MHIPNHGFTQARRKIMSSLGQWSGASDLVIDEPSGPYRSLYIELKVDTPVRKNQKEFLLHKARKGNQCFVCYNLETFMAIVLGYFRNDYSFLSNKNLKFKHIKHESNM